MESHQTEKGLCTESCTEQFIECILACDGDSQCDKKCAYVNEDCRNGERINHILLYNKIILY